MAKVNIELPQGVKSAEELEKLLATFQKQRITSKARDKGVQLATKALREKYADEYKSLVTKLTPKS